MCDRCIWRYIDLLWWLCWYYSIIHFYLLLFLDMFFRKILILILFFLSLVSVVHSEIFALSNNLTGKEIYPGKVDIKNVNGLGKNLSNDFFAWSMNFQYPFVFPEGSRGMNPELTLTYSSNNTDAFSPYGYGFSLSLPRIQRSVKKWVSELYVGNEYVFDGQDLVPDWTKSGQYRSKDMSDMSLYTQTSSGGWIVNMSDGKTRVFWKIESSRIADPNDPSHIYAWLLDEEKDQFGNTIKYTYTLNAGQSYLTTIEYAWKSWDTNPLYRISFDYINKVASLSSYRTQFEVSTKKLLSKVTLSVSGVPSRGYIFQYDSPDTPISHLLSITEFANSGEKLPSISFKYGDGQYQHMITQVDNHRGGKAIFTYAPSTGYRTLSGSLQNEKLPFIVQTLSKQVFTDSVTGVSSTETFEYGSGSYYYDSSDIWGREYVGFGHVMISDSKSKKDIYFHQSKNSELNPLKYNDHIAKKWRQYLSDISDRVTGKLLSREITRYDMRTKGNRWLVFQSYRISSYFDDQKNHKDTAIGYEVDDMGNVLKENQYGWVNADISKWIFLDTPGDTTIIERSYFSNIAKNLYNFPASEKIYGYSWEVLRQSFTRYDLSQTGITLGLPTSQILIDTLDGTEIKDQIEYNIAWMPIKKTDAVGNATSFSYDPYNISLASTTNPLGWKTLFAYDYTSGKISAITDQNQVIKTTNFDVWWREKQKSITTPEKNIILTDTIYDDIRIPNSASVTSYFDENKGDKKIAKTFLDGWGRSIANIGTTEKSWQYTLSHIRYDDDGNAIFASYPIFTSSPDWSNTFVIAGSTDGEKYRAKIPWASYLYDPLGRVISERTSRGITKKVYLPWEESLIDALGYITKNTYNAKGNLIRVTENDGQKDIITNYAYDGLSRPVSLIDALGNIRTWKYDGLGRLSEANDLHSQTDDLYWVRKYRYDLLGRIKEYENPAKETSIYTYDALGRIRTESIGTLPVRTYTYDTNTLGTLANVTDSSSTISYTYDALSRKIGESRTIGDKNYTVSYGYNTADNLTSITYPDNWKTLYTYRNGFIEWVSYTTPSGIINNLITDISYNPNSTMNDIFYGNGAVKHIERDAQYNYRLSRATTSLSGTTLLDTNYTYDGLSDITRIQENGIEPLRKTVNYTYDPLQRLTSASSMYAVGGYGRDQIKNISYAYDPIGNILSTSTVGSYNYSGPWYANPHAVTSAWDTIYTYDALGNTITRNSGSDVFSFVYSPYSEMLSSTKNGETTSYTYDHTRRRITKSSLWLVEHHVIDGYEVEYESGALIEIQSPPQAAKMQIDTSASGTISQVHSSSWLNQTGEVVITSSGTVTNSGSAPSFSGSTTNTGSLSQSGWTQTGSLSTSSWWTTILPESQSGSTQTGTITTTFSGEVITNTGTTSIISSDTASGGSVSGSYMIIAWYIASNSSGSTSINLTTTLTHIMLGDERITTFQTQTDDTPKTSDDEKLVYHISDHLNSSSLDLSNTGIILQATDYEPFGKSITYEVTSKRIKWKKWGYTNKYLFANKQLDDETDLQYFEKRYYDNRIGKFTTEDPVFWEVGLTKRPSQYFSDPQGWNSYAYTENNPINLVDPSGEMAFALPLVASSMWLESVSVAISCNAVCGTVISWVAAWWSVYVLSAYSTTTYYKAMEQLGAEIYDLTHASTDSKKSKSDTTTESQASVSNPPPGWGGNNGGKDKKWENRGENRNQNTSKDYTQLAKKYWMKETTEFGRIMGEKVYKLGSKYYSPEASAHNTPMWWKVFEKSWGKLNRIWTADKNLNIFKK